MGFDSLGDVGEHAAFLDPTGFDHGQGPLDEPTPLGTLSAEAESAPDDRMAQRTLSRVVGGLDTVGIDKLPEPVPVAVQLVAHADQPGIAGARSAQQQAVDGVSHRGHPLAKGLSRDRAGMEVVPMLEHRSDMPHQIMPKALHLPVWMVDQRLDIAFQVSPAPLEPTGLPVHLGTVAVDGAGEPIAQELADSRRRSAEADRKDSERGSHGRPEPRPRRSLFGRRLVHEDLRLFGQGGVEFLVGLCQGLGDLVLHLDGEGRAAGLPEQILEEQCGPPLALQKVRHQQPAERHEPRA